MDATKNQGQIFDSLLRQVQVCEAASIRWINRGGFPQQFLFSMVLFRRLFCLERNPPMLVGSHEKTNIHLFLAKVAFSLLKPRPTEVSRVQAQRPLTPVAS